MNSFTKKFQLLEYEEETKLYEGITKKIVFADLFVLLMSDIII